MSYYKELNAAKRAIDERVKRSGEKGCDPKWLVFEISKQVNVSPKALHGYIEECIEYNLFSLDCGILYWRDMNNILNSPQKELEVEDGSTTD